MDDRVQLLEQDFQKSLQRTIELKVQLDLEKGVVPKVGVPHDNVIEDAAHAVGQEVSRRVQQQHMNELAARRMGSAKCPKCGERCELEGEKRELTSRDGAVGVQELKGYCSACRRAFFPSA